MLIKQFMAALFLGLVCTAQTATPQLKSVVSAGSFQPYKIASGAYATVLGTSLSDKVYIGEMPWPLTLGGAVVMICYSPAVGQQNCAAAQLLYVSPQQINVLMPTLQQKISPPSYGIGETVYVVTNVGGSELKSNSLLFALELDSPDILFVGYECPIGTTPPKGVNCALSNTKTQPTNPIRGTITDAAGGLVDSANPAVIGGYYTIWLTGLGNTAYDPPLTFTLLPWKNVPLAIKPLFAGASPQFPGLEQINFQLPSAIAVSLDGSCQPEWESDLYVSQGLGTPPGSSVQIPVVIRSC
ncbi:MAG TPA: hypothetical protein VN841_29545 [Bryobacteraceae bacterium]|nr:hypothetical protein [Bryobacteraceae bacterium]